jgi:hypothetical protein
VEINDGSEWTLFRTVSAAPAPAETTLVSVGDAEVPGGAIFRVIVTTE